MLNPYLFYRHPDLFHVNLCLFNGCPSISLSPPSLHVLGHFVVTALFLVRLIAQLAISGQVVCLVDQLQTTSLARSVLLIALLSEISPFPEPALPTGLLEITHVRAGMGDQWLIYCRGALPSTGKMR